MSLTDILHAIQLTFGEICNVTTVEPPGIGHFGEMAFVPCREVVPISKVCPFFHCIALTHVFFQFLTFKQYIIMSYYGG